MPKSFRQPENIKQGKTMRFIALLLSLILLPTSVYAEKFYQKPHESLISRFEEGHAFFRKYDEQTQQFIGMGMIDRDHNIVIPPIYRDLNLPQNGKVIAGLENEQGERFYGILNLKNEWLVQPQRFDHMDDFRDGMARVELNKKYGFVDENGKMIVPMIYDEVQTFTSNKAAVKRNGKWGAVDKTGKEIIAPQFDFMGYFSGNANVVCRDKPNSDKTDKCAVIDETGSLKTPFKYDSVAIQFLCGVLSVRKNGKYGFVDGNGKEVVPLIYHDVLNVSIQTVQMENGEIVGIQTQEDCSKLAVYPHKKREAVYIPNPVFKVKKYRKQNRKK